MTKTFFISIASRTLAQGDSAIFIDFKAENNNAFGELYKKYFTTGVLSKQF